MSDFVQQQNNTCDFNSSDSWVILSPIEQNIKRKIEAVGTPLKDWDIQINYGIKTGFNDAFIISTEKRNEILANCKDEDERQRTAELIRPILRGRDIKRYGYEWANLWLIATFPSRHYDIDKYPSVKQYLLSFGIERLEQTGKTHIVNGEKVKAQILNAIFVLFVGYGTDGFVLVVRLGEKEDVCVNCGTLKNLNTSKVNQQHWVCLIGKEVSRCFSIIGTHPLVGCYITKMTSFF